MKGWKNSPSDRYPMDIRLWWKEIWGKLVNRNENRGSPIFDLSNRRWGGDAFIIPSPTQYVDLQYSISQGVNLRIHLSYKFLDSYFKLSFIDHLCKKSIELKLFNQLILSNKWMVLIIISTIIMNRLFISIYSIWWRYFSKWNSLNVFFNLICKSGMLWIVGYRNSSKMFSIEC